MILVLTGAANRDPGAHRENMVLRGLSELPVTLA